MWDQSASDFGNGTMAGGFFNAGTPGGTVNTPGEKKGGAQRAHNIIPVNIKDILDAIDEKLKIEDTEAHMVTFVGTVEQIESKQTNVSYTVRDDTGSIEVVQWIEGEGNVQSPFQVVEGNFCRVVGSIRQTQDRRHVMAFRVAKLTTANEITTHLLETQWVRMKLRQMKRKMGEGTGQSMNNSVTGGGMTGPLASSSSATSNVANGIMSGLSSFQSMVYTIIQATTAETGMEKSQIYNSVRGRMIPRDVDAALEFLCSEGHIYSTVDEDHFKSTDS
ncbi:replication protein A 32 kDa subunit-like [Daphnia pulicaria]|uniref:replication protein A 32 kDa subunit-like n=1 Tax=Daphnia pulicaria TaxID=35523 RepID=UPI001EE9C046|nr:replication protein A 32 kDa subunit-like [Daphnia pulicaria]